MDNIITVYIAPNRAITINYDLTNLNFRGLAPGIDWERVNVRGVAKIINYLRVTIICGS